MRMLVAKDDDVDRMTGSSIKPKKIENPQQHQKSYGLAAVPPKQRNCMFCESSNHSPSKCPLPPQVKNGKILKAKRCTRCLRSGHFNKQCTAEPCRKCNGPHHTFLCYKNGDENQSHTPREAIQNEPSTMVFATSGTKSRPLFFKKAKSPRIMRKPITFRSVGVNCRDGPKYLLMTRMVTVFNLLTGWACKVGVMIDPGSTETYITKDLKRKLKLKTGPVQTFKLVRFGDVNRPQQLSGPTAQIGIRCSNEAEHISIDGMVVSDFLPALFCSELNNEDKTYWSDQCRTMPPGRFVKPDILLGMKHLHLLKLQCQESRGDGFQWWDTSIGPIICGVQSNNNIGVTTTALCKQVCPVGVASSENDEDQTAYSYKPASWNPQERVKYLLHIENQINRERQREWQDEFHKRRQKSLENNKVKAQTMEDGKRDSTWPNNELPACSSDDDHTFFSGRVSDLADKMPFGNKSASRLSSYLNILKYVIA